MTQPSNVEIELTPAANTELQRLAQISGISVEDVLRTGLLMMRIYGDEVLEKGNAMVVVDPSGRIPSREVRLPFPDAGPGPGAAPVPGAGPRPGKSPGAMAVAKFMDVRCK